MRHDAVALIRARRAARPRAGKRVPPALQPDGVQREYLRDLRRVVRRLRELVEAELAPALRGGAQRVDAPPPPPPDGGFGPPEQPYDLGQLRLALRQAAEQWAAEFPDRELEALGRKIGDRTQRFQRQQWNRQVDAALGLEPGSTTAAEKAGFMLRARSLASVDPTRSETWLEPKIRDFAWGNARLVTKMVDETKRQIEEVVTTAAREGVRHEVLAKLVRERTGVAESRAKLIARDQVISFYGDLARTRQQEAGVTGYTWRTSRDNRVREEHEALDGTKQTWAQPPVVDTKTGRRAHPGEDILCRCQAEPDLSVLLRFGE